MLRTRASRRLLTVLPCALLIVAGGTAAGDLLPGGRSGRLDSPIEGPDPAATGSPGARQDSVSRPAVQYDSAFGYELGEERRYVLEPQSSLRPGESASWSIILYDISGEGDDTRIVFDLEHQRSELIRDVFGGPSGRMQVVDVTGRLTVNRFGFPQRLVISEQHDLSGETGSQSEIRTTLFTFDGERMVKQVRIDGREWSFNISIANHDDLDLEVPYGMYAYVPTGLGCLGNRGTPGRPARCASGEPAFANPGLLSLALPVMWEEQVNEKEFLFFMPAGVGTLPSGLMNMNGWLRRERDTLRNFTRYYEKTDLEVKDYVQGAELGPRTVDAWKLDGSGRMGELLTDPDGRVLRVKLEPHPVTYGERWIRLLFPSEY